MYPHELTRLAENSGWDIFSPEWDFWGHIPSQSVESCCALSVGLDPKFGDIGWTTGLVTRIRNGLYPPPKPLPVMGQIPGLMALMMQGESPTPRPLGWHDSHVAAFFEDIAARLDTLIQRVLIVQSNLAPLGSIPCIQATAPGIRAVIRVDEFVKFASAKAWEIPPELLAMTNQREEHLPDALPRDREPSRPEALEPPWKRPRPRLDHMLLPGPNRTLQTARISSGGILLPAALSGVIVSQAIALVLNAAPKEFKGVMKFYASQSGKIKTQWVDGFDEAEQLAADDFHNACSTLGIKPRHPSSPHATFTNSAEHRVRFELSIDDLRKYAESYGVTVRLEGDAGENTAQPLQSGLNEPSSAAIDQAGSAPPDTARQPPLNAAISEPRAETDIESTPSLIVSAIPVSATTAKHSGKKKRMNILDPVIDDAVREVGTVTDAVFVKLREKALAGEEPFESVLEDGSLKYTGTRGKVKTLTRDALDKRLKYGRNQ